MGLKRIGIFGGSFDPLHCGHVSIAKLARKQFNLYTVYIVPVFDQWLKGHDLFADPEDRLDMAQAAVTDIEGIEVEGGEKQEEGEAGAEEDKVEGGEEKKEEAKEE